LLCWGEQETAKGSPHQIIRENEAGTRLMFDKSDWRGCIVSLATSRWRTHIQRNRGWRDDRNIPRLMNTIGEPDIVHPSADFPDRLELYRLFADVGDGSAGFMLVVVQYEPDTQNPVSGRVVTAFVVDRLPSGGIPFWKR
jgi:hypothetical protein